MSDDGMGLGTEIPEPGEVDPGRFDHRVPTRMKEPWWLLHELRDKCPVAKSELYGGVTILTRYEDVFEAARDPATFSSADGVALPQHPFPPSIPIEIDPPEHREFRMALLDKFSPPTVARSLGRYTEIISGALDEVIESGRCELVGDILHPMVGGVTGDLLNFPDEDMLTLTHWASSILAGADNVMMIMGDVIEYFAELYEDRLANPQDDIPTLIAQMEVLGRVVTEDEFLRTMLALFVAGLDTTVSAGAHIVEYLAENPEVKAQLLADRDNLPTAIEEFLRWVTPVPSLRRMATIDTEIDGCPVAAGTNVLLFWMAANHDPSEFVNPDDLKFDRFPNRHLSFGAGIHRCLGAHVARQELKVLLEQVLTRMDDLRLDPGEPPERFESTSRGIARLPLLFGPGERIN